MAAMERRPVVIIGSGPAGSATALYIERADPGLARETLMLDKAVHPRDKVCAGGLIPHVLHCLDELGVALEVPNVVVRSAAVRVPGRRVFYRGRQELCRVVRRAEFDALLARKCVERGVTLHEGERVVEVAAEGSEFRIETERASYLTPILVGADGSGSLVRRRLITPGTAHIGRAVMCDIPLVATNWDGFAEARYDWDFSAVAHRLRGYAWAFPCLIDGVPHVNVGVYSVVPEGRYLHELLEQQVESLGARVARAKAFPIHWYYRCEPISAPGVLLVGDAAGVDPLMGEGISFSFEYGRRAAEAIVDAHRRSDFSCAGYASSVRASWVGRKLGRLYLGTRLFYGPTWKLWFAVAARSRRAQAIGIRWFNGVDGWDQKSIWQAVQAVWRGEYVDETSQETVA